MLNARGLVLIGIYALIGVVVFAGVRAYTIDAAPKRVMDGIEQSFVKASGAWDACFHIRKFGPRAASPNRANPDSIVSAMAYDVSDGPVRISGPIWPDYWSLSLYQQNSDNFFVVNDMQLGAPDFDIVIARADQSVDGLKGQVVVSPTDNGVMLIRRFVKEEGDMPAILANQDAMYCGSAS